MNVPKISKVILSILLVTFFAVNVFSQVNAYAEVTNIGGNVLTLGSINESFDTFEDGEALILIQIQDNVIGNVTNTASFGNIGAILNAGEYKVLGIASHTEMAGSPTSITLSAPPMGFNIGPNSSVQIISYPALGTPDFTTISDITGVAWDGAIGGVVAFQVDGVLTLNHNISANNIGFRGAGANGGSSIGCSGGGNYRVVTQANFADKGEGIYKNSNASYVGGIGKILNGGGGGNSHNGGGGGGGNYSAGGNGGPGYPTCNPSAGGLGGLSLNSYIGGSRVFLGGGGGSGEGNNDLATGGGDGGGIIFIKADEIITESCVSSSITANGENIGFSGNDGGGGGGSGGSIILEVNTWNISGSCPASIEANGGDGGFVTSGAVHGGGGGGGQGVVIFSVMEPFKDVVVSTNNGEGGCNNNSSPCTSPAGSGSLSDNNGIIDIASTTLPVELIFFKAKQISEEVHLSWSTASEVNNWKFEIEKSLDGYNWFKIGERLGQANYSGITNYEDVDLYPNNGVNFYRLKQIDYNGESTYSNIDIVEFLNDTKLEIVLDVQLNCLRVQSNFKKEGFFELWDLQGKLVFTKVIAPDSYIYIPSFSPGIYIGTINGFSRKVRIP